MRTSLKKAHEQGNKRKKVTTSTTVINKNNINKIVKDRTNKTSYNKENPHKGRRAGNWER